MNKLILKNTVNEIFVTATENVSISNPYFLWELTSHTSKTSTVFLSANLSTATTRYDKFRIIETGTTSVNLSASTINLDATGFYDYKIYQQSSSTNLSLNATGSLLEQGLLLVSGSPAVITYIKADTTMNYITYQS